MLLRPPAAEYRPPKHLFNVQRFCPSDQNPVLNPYPNPNPTEVVSFGAGRHLDKIFGPLGYKVLGKDAPEQLDVGYHIYKDIFMWALESDRGVLFKRSFYPAL